MAVPSTSTNFGDLLDPRFKRVFVDQYKQEPDVIPRLFSMPGGGDFPTKADARFSQIGTFGDVPEFTGTITFDDITQGYDTTLTHKQYATGFQVDRPMFDDDLYGVMDAKPKGLAIALQRTRQKHAASVFLNAFSVDATWQSGGDGVSLCNNSHTTNAAGVSTSTGFDNLITASLTAVAVEAARIQMRKFRDDRGNPFEVAGDGLLYPVDLSQAAEEIMGSSGKPDTANNNINTLKGTFSALIPGGWIRLTDVNDWWMVDRSYMQQFLLWLDRVTQEFGMVEDFDTLIAKWRLYCRYSLGYTDWRWILGSQVS